MGSTEGEGSNKVVWYLDSSGCSMHMTGSRNLLSNFIEQRGLWVTFSDNSLGFTKGYGTLVIGSVKVTNVAYVSGLKHNLLSISQFYDRDYSVEFSSTFCYVKNTSTQ